jgi:hypothetical protein
VPGQQYFTRGAAILLAALAVALALVPAAGAVPVQLKVGDSIDVTSTEVGCFTKVSADRKAINLRARDDHRPDQGHLRRRDPGERRHGRQQGQQEG